MLYIWAGLSGRLRISPSVVGPTGIVNNHADGTRQHTATRRHASHIFVRRDDDELMMPNLTRVGSESDAMHGAKLDPGGTAQILTA